MQTVSLNKLFEKEDTVQLIFLPDIQAGSKLILILPSSSRAKLHTVSSDLLARSARCASLRRLSSYIISFGRNVSLEVSEEGENSKCGKCCSSSASGSTDGRRGSGSRCASCRCGFRSWITAGFFLSSRRFQQSRRKYYTLLQTETFDARQWIRTTDRSNMGALADGIDRSREEEQT